MHTYICITDSFCGTPETKTKLLTRRRPGFGSLGQEEPLKKGMATHSNILAWEIPWTEGFGEL